MRFIVRIPELDFALYEDDMQKARHEIFNVILKLKKSRKLIDGGILADDHGGFLIVEASSWAELENLTNSVFNPRIFHVESHPILSFDSLQQLFETLERNEKLRLEKTPAMGKTLKKSQPVFSL
jgi:hypothetical protein